MRTRRDFLQAASQFAFVIAIFTAAFFCGGCASNDVTNPARSVTEQLLLSTAADRAMTNADLSIFAGKKVFLDASFFEGYDSKYAVGDIRDALSSAGALLVEDITNCDVLVEARSGALSIDYSTSLFGIPNMGMPIPLAGALQIPEVAFYKSDAQSSIAKIALLAYDYKSRQHFYSSGPLIGKAYNNFHKIFIVSWLRSDIPEKQKPKKEKRGKKSGNRGRFASPPPSSPQPASAGAES